MRIALCYFGLPRALALTAPSLRANLEAPLRAQAEVVTLAHVYERSAEPGETVPDISAFLELDELETEPPMQVLERADFDALRRHGDFWGDGGTSLRNLLHQLHSLERVTLMARAAGVEACLFARPDLLYRDALPGGLAAAAQVGPPGIWLPSWQHWKGGLNDRCAFCHGTEAIAAYGLRGRLAQAFCARTGGPLQSEQLVAYALWTAGITWRPLPLRASRVRSDGRVVEEDFGPRRLRVLRQKIKLRAR